MSGSVSSRKTRQFSTIGAIAMAAGLGLVFYELSTGLVTRRLGSGGKVTILTCGVFFSVWGLKEIIAGFFPSMRRSAIGRHRFHLPIEGQVYLVIMFVLFIGSILGRSNPLMLVFSLMAGPFIVNGWLTFTLLKKLSVRRAVPDRVMAGDPVAIDVTLGNGKRLMSSWLMTVVDRVANSQEELQPSVLFARIPPRGARSGHYTLRLMQRGVYAFGPIQVRTRFPLGLVERGLNIDVYDQIVVYPRIGRLVADWQDRLLEAEQLHSSARPRGGLFNDEFHKLRDYRAGDDLRAIHWKTSARRDELMVREFQISRDQLIAVLLDAWLPELPSELDAARAELAIGLAATMCADQSRHGREAVPLFAANGPQGFTWGGATGSHRLESLLDGLARLTPTHGADVAGLLESTRQALTSRHRVVLVTSRPADAERRLDQWAAQNRAERSRLRARIEVVDPESDRATALVQWS
jgi:uncharacterized protein (DUF58 family)